MMVGVVIGNNVGGSLLGEEVWGNRQQISKELKQKIADEGVRMILPLSDLEITLGLIWAAKIGSTTKTSAVKYVFWTCWKAAHRGRLFVGCFLSAMLGELACLRLVGVLAFERQSLAVLNPPFSTNLF